MLRLLYNDSESTFEQLLSIDNTFTIHEANIQKLMTEMYKAKTHIGPSLLQDIFRDPLYRGPNLRNRVHFIKPNIKTQKYGERSLEYFGTMIWDLLPPKIKEANSLEEFKLMIKYWKPNKCPCYLCKHFVKGVGLVDICNCDFCH